VAELTDGKSGAEIENIVNLAALQSVRKAIQAKQSNAKMTGAELIEFT
jgi:SpoVK/Ycf46/Vps4 family AAA+-type ATPase